MRFERLLAVATGIGVTALPRIASACAVCGLGPNDVGGHAFNSSVLFMMAVPYTTVLVVGGAIYLTWRRAAQRRNASPIAGAQKY